MSKQLEAKIDRVIEKQGEMNATLASLTTTVEVHVKRSNLLEEKIALDKSELQLEIEPIRKFMDMAKGALKLLGAIGVGALIKALYGG